MSLNTALRLLLEEYPKASQQGQPKNGTLHMKCFLVEFMS